MQPAICLPHFCLLLCRTLGVVAIRNLRGGWAESILAVTHFDDPGQFPTLCTHWSKFCFCQLKAHLMGWRPRTKGKKNKPQVSCREGKIWFLSASPWCDLRRGPFLQHCSTLRDISNLVWRFLLTVFQFHPSLNQQPDPLAAEMRTC